MNIIFYKNRAVVPEKGGIARITANLCNLFRKHGDEVWFVGIINSYKNVSLDKNQLFLPDSHCIYSQNNLDYLCQIVSENKIDIIINQNAFPAQHIELLYQCGKRTGVKIVYCFHNSILTPVYNYAYTRQFLAIAHGKFWYFKLLNTPLVRKVVEWACIAKYYTKYRNLIRKNDGIVLLCEGQIGELEKASGVSPIPKVHVIYNGMKLPKNQGLQRKKHVLWVGHFDYHIKRPDNMLRIWQKVESHFPEWSLYMLGDGVSLEYCKKMAGNMGLHNVVFTGRVPPQSYYQEAEILCTTSIHECFPMVLLEGMNNELVLMAFNSFTSAELLVTEKDNGILVPPFDIDKYAESLAYLMKEEGERRRLQSNSKKALERFSEEHIYEMWENLFSEI